MVDRTLMGAAMVVVSGHPAAGKSTLARRLGTELGYVVVSRDRLAGESGLRALQAALPSDRWHLVPAATDRIVNFMIEAVLDSGNGVVVDGNFNWHEQRQPVRDLVERRRPVCAEVCLWGDAGVLKQRYADRAEPPMDDTLASIVDRALARPREPVLSPPAPILQFDTTDLRTIDDAYPSVLATVRSAG